MAVVAVTADNIRLDDAETTVDWGIIGGGPGGSLETDFKYQGSTCFARKGATAQRGIFLSDNVDSDLSGAGTHKTVMFKFICTTPGLLDLLSVPGMKLEIGSGSITSTPSTDFHFYDVQGSDTYPVDKSWLVLPIDPNIASHRTGTTGSPTLTLIDYYALRYDQTAVSKSPNQALDAVDIGDGLTLVGGDGIDVDGVWQDFSTFDFGTAANRFGYVREVDGAGEVFLVFGQMVIGTSAAAGFQNTASTLLFPDGLFAAGFSGITIDLQNASTDVDFIRDNYLGKGTSAGEDTRPTLTVTGTSGAFDATTCVFDNFAVLTLTSAVTFLGCTITNSEGLVQAGATLDGLIVSGATTADGVAFITSDDPSLISNGNFTFSDGHAIEATATGTYAFNDNDFVGYGLDDTNDAAFFNNSGGLITLNVSGGSGLTVRNGSGASTVIVQAVTVRVLARDASDLTVIQNVRVLLEADDTGPLPFQDSVTITRSGSTATVTHTAHGRATGEKMLIKGANEQEYNGVFVITVTGTNTYTYTVSGTPDTPATGTIIATMVILDGLTNASGIVEDTGFNFPGSDQDVTGRARKGTSTPFFVSAPLIGTITTNGVTINVSLVPDE